MKKNITDAVIVHCIDFRFQKYLDPWIKENYGCCNYDRVSIAGGVFDFEAVFKQVQISGRLHKIKKVIFVNHEDCGAYGEEGSQKRHTIDLRIAREKVNQRCSHLDVELYYLYLNGEFEKIS